MNAASDATEPQVHIGIEVLGEGPMQALLQRGVRVPAQVPCTLGDFLVDQLGVDPDVVARRVSTIFVDGSVVDVVDATELRDGSVLALSAAMPGLVGATLRRGGFYARMRAEITAAATAAGGASGPAAPGVVTVKLFNLLIAELGPPLLAHGVLLPRAEAVALLGPGALLPGDGEVLVRGPPGEPS
jgi:hypothetical protein